MQSVNLERYIEWEICFHVYIAVFRLESARLDVEEYIRTIGTIFFLPVVYSDSHSVTD